MENDLNEMNFLIAKYLNEHFPDVGELFIKKCEENSKFPKCALREKRSFEQLNSTIFKDCLRKSS